MRNDTVRNLDTLRLRTFITVAETANMTRAAELMNQTQGAVSQQIRKLEEELGHVLFQRDRPGLTLTDSGERLLAKARRLLSINDAIWCEMTTPRCGGHVSLGVPADLIGGCRLAESIRSFSHRYPDVDIKLRCSSSGDLKRAVSNGDIDVAILEEHPREQEGETLITDRLIWIGAIGGEAVSRDPLPLSLVSGSCIFRPHVHAALDTTGRKWKSVFESESFEATTAMIRTDLAVGVILSARKPEGTEELTQEAGLPALPSFTISLMTRNVRTEQATALTEHFRRELVSQNPTEAIVA